MADETNRRDKPDAPDEQRKPASFGKWMLRAAIGLVLGLGIGAAAGVFVVDTLEPGNPGQPDSLQVLLDSVARSQPPAAPTKRDTAPPVPEPEPEEPATVVPVPDLRDLDEGAAPHLTPTSKGRHLRGRDGPCVVVESGVGSLAVIRTVLATCLALAASLAHHGRLLEVFG